MLQLIDCGKELKEHCEIENRMFFPAIKSLERELKSRIEEQNTVEQIDYAEVDLLTDREKEVLREITYGFPTKEIADKMCLSFHTITTYRRNIAEKLNIHSAAGMAVYAIFHHIVNLNEISLQASCR